MSDPSRGGPAGEIKMLPCHRCGFDPCHLHTTFDCLERVTAQLKEHQKVDGWRRRPWSDAEEACDAIAERVGIGGYDWDWSGLRDAVSDVVYERDQEQKENEKLRKSLTRLAAVCADWHCDNMREALDEARALLEGK